MKKKYLTIRIDSHFLENYKKMRNQIGYTQSKRIRSLMEFDLKNHNQGKNTLI